MKTVIEGSETAKQNMTFVFEPDYDKSTEYAEYSLTRSKIINRLRYDLGYHRSDALKALHGMNGDYVSSMAPDLMEPPFDDEEDEEEYLLYNKLLMNCLLYTSPSPRDLSTSRMPSSA